MEIPKVEGLPGMGLAQVGRALRMILVAVGLLALGFVAGLRYAGDSPPIQTFDTRLGKCGQNGCQEYLIAIGKEVHPAGCTCQACKKFGPRDVPRHYTQLVCAVGHHRMAPANEQ